MKTILAISVVPVLFMFGLAEERGVHFKYSYAFGKKYACRISRDRLLKSPSWVMEQSDNPPFPAGKAIRLANAAKDKLVKDSDDFKWYLMFATLECLYPPNFSEDPDVRDKWWWEVTYEAHSRTGGEGGGVNDLVILVLMDGLVITPEVSEDK